MEPGDELPRPDRSAAGMVRALRGRWPARVEVTWPEAARRALGAARRWQAAVDRSGLAAAGPEVLGRGDHDRASFLRHGGLPGHVDFEDACGQERAFELAEWVEHVKSRPTPDATWDDFVGEFGMRPAERGPVPGGVQQVAGHGRLAVGAHREVAPAARRWLAIFWLLMLLPGAPAWRRNPPAMLQLQSERLLALLDGG